MWVKFCSHYTELPEYDVERDIGWTRLHWRTLSPLEECCLAWGWKTQKISSNCRTVCSPCGRPVGLLHVSWWQARPRNALHFWKLRKQVWPFCQIVHRVYILATPIQYVGFNFIFGQDRLPESCTEHILMPEAGITSRTVLTVWLAFKSDTQTRS